MNADEVFPKPSQLAFKPLPIKDVSFEPSALSSTSYDIQSFCLSDFYNSSEKRQGGGSSDSGTETSDTDGLSGDDRAGFSMGVSQFTANMEIDQVDSVYSESESYQAVIQSSSSTVFNSSHNQFNNICPVCSFITEEHSSLIHHLNLCHPEHISSTCKTCSQSFALSEMLRHVSRCKGSHVCEQCKSTFAQRAHLLRHISRTHHLVDRCVCDICGNILSSKSSLKTHKKQHDCDFRFKCQFCGLDFIQYFHLQLHIDNQHAQAQLAGNPKPHECVKCGRAFIFMVSLKVHQREHQNREKKKLLSCVRCDKTYAHASELQRHECTHLPSESRPLRCSQCSRTFIRRYNLLEHEAWHQNKQVFACPECNQVFVSFDNLRGHLQKHMSKDLSDEDDTANDDIGGIKQSLGRDKDLTKAIIEQVTDISHSDDLDLQFFNDFLSDDANSGEALLTA